MSDKRRSWLLPVGILVLGLAALVFRQLHLDWPDVLRPAQQGVNQALRWVWPVLVVLALLAWQATADGGVGWLALAAAAPAVSGFVPQSEIRPLLYLVGVWAAVLAGLTWVPSERASRGLPRVCRAATGLMTAVYLLFVLLVRVALPYRVGLGVGVATEGLQVLVWGTLLAAVWPRWGDGGRLTLVWVAAMAAVQALLHVQAIVTVISPGLLGSVTATWRLLYSVLWPVTVAGAIWSAGRFRHGPGSG